MNKEDLEIEALVSDYKNGNQEAGAILLSKYGYEPNNEPSKLIGKYYNLLIHGRVNLRDKDTRRFLQLYMSKKESREGLTYHYTSFSASNQAYSVSDYLIEKFSIYEKEDILNDLVLLFLECVQRYENISKNISFSGYIYNYYRYKVYRYYQKKLFSKDVTSKETTELPENIQSSYYLNEESIDWFLSKEYNRIKESEDLNLLWINGACHPLFSYLKPFERSILKLHYVDKLSDGEIGALIGYHKNTIFKKRQAIVKKLSIYVEIYKEKDIPL